MIFSSVTFLFFFLPAVIAVYFLAPRRFRNLVLLIGSLVFYAWGAGYLAIVLLFSIAVNYLSGGTVQRLIAAGDRRSATIVLAIAVAVNLGMLAWFKYASFASSIIADLVPTADGQSLPVLEILLPIGISFFTFHSISYLMDVYRGVAQHLPRPVDFALYISFFPQLVAGPIVRFHEIRDQLLHRTETAARFASGVYRFGFGLAKKVLIADSIAPIADAVFATRPEDLTMTTAAIGVVAYAVQLYFDFSGYTDMALGLAAMFGIRLPENFQRPYSSRSVTEFWRRWHMSLSRWFRDYVYIPLGGNRGSELRTYRNLIVVFLLTGLWHGADWTFIAWGAYHGVLLLIERARGIGRGPDAARRHVLGQLRTTILVLFGWILFRSSDLEYATGFMRALVRPGDAIPLAVASALGPVPLIAMALGLASFLLPGDWVTGVRLESDRGRLAAGLRLLTVAVLIPLSLMFLVAGTFSPFLYFQF